jgi:phosphoglycolate phosphatase
MDAKLTHIRAVLFDLDGVLIDSLPDITNSVNRALACHGLPPLSRETIRGFVGHGARPLLARAFAASAVLALPGTAAPPPQSGTPAIEALYAEYVAIYQARSAENTAPYPGVPELLALLEKRGIPCAVVSNKPYLVTEAALGAIGLRGFFAAIVDPDRVKHIKPAPDALEAALAAINAQRAGNALPPSAALMVGDTDTDIIAGRAFGCPTCAVTGGYGDQADLLAQKADMVVPLAGDLQHFF